MYFLPIFFLVDCLVLDSSLLMLWMQQKSLQNPLQVSQMNPILPILLGKESFDAKELENKELLIMMMMKGEDLANSKTVLPLLLLADSSLDFTSIFLYTHMMKQGMFYKF